MQELFSYSLMTSGLGILIVFLILVLLSVLMILIRKFSDIDTSKKSAVTAAATATVAADTAASPSPIPLPVLVAVAAAEAIPDSNSEKWIPAAVTAYIAALEDDSVRPRAINWAAGGTAKYDPWVSNNKVTKTAPGA